MAYFYRIALILFFCIPSISHAFAPVEYFYDQNHNTAYTSNTAACEGNKNILQLQYPDGSLIQQGDCPEPAGGGSNVTFFNATNSNYYNLPVYSRYVCFGHDNSFNVDNVSSSTNCSTGQPPPCVDGQADGPQNAAAETPVTPQVGCHNGCEVLWNPDGAPYIGCSEGSGIGFCSYYQSGGYKQTGSTCSGASVTPGPDKPKPINPNPCPVCDCLQAGKSWGTINGTTVCVTAGSAGSNPVKFPAGTTTTTPSGGGSSTTTNNNNNTSITISNNSSSSSSGGSSSNPASSATVTATKSDGSTVTQPMTQFCQENPTAAICKSAENGTFGGSCSTGFTCDGDDAIKCAIAQEQHQRACQFYQPSEPLNALASKGSQVMDGTADLGGTDTFAHPTEFNVGTLDETSFLPKQCLPDMMFQIMNQTITLPLSRLCDGLQAAGKIVLAFAFVVAARIIFS